MNKATVVRELTCEDQDPRVKQLLVKLSPPYEGFEYAVVSASSKAHHMFGTRSEVMVFGATERGDIHYPAVLAESANTLEHARPLMDMGYSLRMVQ